VERAGNIEELVRVAKITNLASFDSGTIEDFLSGLPAVGSSHPTISEMVLEDREVQAVSASAATVNLIYRWHRTTANWVAHGTASLYQAPRQKDINGTQITVSHDGDIRGMEVSGFFPQETIVIEVVEETNTPEAGARAFLNKLNSVIWLGDPILTWFCSDVDYSPRIETTSPQFWNMRYTFQYNPETFDQWVAYKLPDGTLPQGLVLGTGLKQVAVHEIVDFNTKFA